MAKSQFLMLAETYVPGKCGVRGWWVSEKLDGVRAVWDGGVSRGMACSAVPYANTAKHERFKSPPMATGLWSRYGQAIAAPDWWLNQLPRHPLDGELYLGRKQFQKTVSIVQTKVDIDEDDWNGLSYHVFDMPSPAQLFRPRSIVLPIAQFDVQYGTQHWWRASGGNAEWMAPVNMNDFVSRCGVIENEVVRPVGMVRLPLDEAEALAKLDEIYTNVLSLGGEGVMLRANSQQWQPERVKGLLKVKPVERAVAEVRDYVFAEPGKICGLIGAVVCEMLTTEGERTGNFFKLSGFTDTERQLAGGNTDEIVAFGHRFPGHTVPPHWYSAWFPRGTKIKYAYRELSDAGLPKDPRFLR